MAARFLKTEFFEFYTDFMDRGNLPEAAWLRN